MAIFENIPETIFVLIITVFCLNLWKCLSRRRKTSVPTNWPMVGMLPAVFQNFHRIHDFASELLGESGGTFEFKGPWFCNMDMLITCDPNNIHHMMTKNFFNYPKGSEYKKIFEILGDGIFNADFELWEFHRRTTRSFMSDARFYRLLMRAVWQKVETGLLPVLDYFSEQGTDFDLQDIFQRFSLDHMCKLVLNHDPLTLSVDLLYNPTETAFNDTIDAVLCRYILPEPIWKLQKWLGIGKERKLAEARTYFDGIIYPHINLNEDSGQRDGSFSLLSAFKKAYEENYGPCSSDQTTDFLRDTALSLILAGRDTTGACLTWFFWLMANNPSAESKIRDEIETVLDNKWGFFSIEKARKLVCLHGALCESVRLFPPIALEHKAPMQPDILPSGHSIRQNDRVIISFCATGRMEDLWGKDCLEFKPERWITANRGLKREPSYKFPAFNAGPRTCLGKEMAFIQMKMVVAAVVHHYNIELVEGHPVYPRDSIVTQAKHGLRVRLFKRHV